MAIGRAAQAFRVLLTPVTLLLLFACADTERVSPAQREAGTSRLFARAYEEVMNYYIQPLAPKDLAVPALRRLASLDPALAVAVEGDEIVLRDKDAVVRRLPQPGSRDAAGWGEITAAMLTSATHESSAVANLTEDERD